MDSPQAVVLERTARALDALLPGAAATIRHALRLPLALGADAAVRADLVANARVVLDGPGGVVAQALRAQEVEELLSLARHEVTLGQGSRALILLARALTPDQGVLSRFAAGLAGPDRKLLAGMRAWVAAALCVGPGRRPVLEARGLLELGCVFLPRAWGLLALGVVHGARRAQERARRQADADALVRATVLVRVLDHALRQAQGSLREVLEAVLGDLHSARLDVGGSPSC